MNKKQKTKTKNKNKEQRQRTTSFTFKKYLKYKREIWNEGGMRRRRIFGEVMMDYETFAGNKMAEKEEAQESKKGFLSFLFVVVVVVVVVVVF